MNDKELMKEQVVTALLRVHAVLTDALHGNYWDAEAEQAYELAKELTDWHARFRAGQPQTWSVPPEPGPEVTRVRDGDGREWRRPTSTTPYWQGPHGQLATWVLILSARGPLTDVSARHQPTEPV